MAHGQEKRSAVPTKQKCSNTGLPGKNLMFVHRQTWKWSSTGASRRFNPTSRKLHPIWQSFILLTWHLLDPPPTFYWWPEKHQKSWILSFGTVRKVKIATTRLRKIRSLHLHWSHWICMTLSSACQEVVRTKIAIAIWSRANRRKSPETNVGESGGLQWGEIGENHLGEFCFVS